MMIRLLLVDDHAVVRSGLRMLLENEQDFVILGEAGTAAEAVSLAASLEPDVVLMDIGLPDATGIEATKRIKQAQPTIAVVALTAGVDMDFVDPVAGSASGGAQQLFMHYSLRAGVSL